ncbi:MAG: PKD domain-containing protein [Owenweeksia sp.]|nr:PKD domain-containing protein [Owenweeksia sp.]
MPQADFDASRASGKACGGSQLFSFSNLTQVAAGYYWDFDYNGQRGTHTFTQLNASHLYLNPGCTILCWWLVTAMVAPDTAFKQVLVRPKPVAGFYADPRVGCAPLTVTFYDTSTYNFAGPGGIENRTWTFGDGAVLSTTDSVVTHTYADPGLYNVSLLVETDGGCLDSVRYEDYIEVLESPSASFTSKNITANKVQFQNLSNNTDGGTTYRWEFGDGRYSV